MLRTVKVTFKRFKWNFKIRISNSPLDRIYHCKWHIFKLVLSIWLGHIREPMAFGVNDINLGMSRQHTNSEFKPTNSISELRRK